MYITLIAQIASIYKNAHSTQITFVLHTSPSGVEAALICSWQEWKVTHRVAAAHQGPWLLCLPGGKVINPKPLLCVAAGAGLTANR